MGWICEVGIVVSETPEKAYLELVKRTDFALKPHHVKELKPGQILVDSRELA